MKESANKTAYADLELDYEYTGFHHDPMGKSQAYNATFKSDPVDGKSYRHEKFVVVERDYLSWDEDINYIGYWHTETNNTRVVGYGRTIKEAATRAFDMLRFTERREVRALRWKMNDEAKSKEKAERERLMREYADAGVYI
jgi:hypothetical protein